MSSASATANRACADCFSDATADKARSSSPNASLALIAACRFNSLRLTADAILPFIVFNDEGKPWFSAGSPGGSRIITAALQMIVNVIDHGRGIADALAMPRIHHQWFPDKLQVESIHSPDTLSILRERGHGVNNVQSTFTSLQVVAIVDGVFQGAADPRRPDAAAVAPARINVDKD